MKTRLRKGKDFLKRISAGAAAALMAVVTVISNMEPLVAKAEGYTLVDYDNGVSYADVFSGIDNGMGDGNSVLRNLMGMLLRLCVQSHTRRSRV